ncbi:MAG: hypothetical protein ABJE47_20960 [bacterium]
MAVRDTVLIQRLPDSARYYHALAARPTIAGDSARVDVFSSKALQAEGVKFMNLMRYVFVHDEQTGWRFVRRMLLYAS